MAPIMSTRQATTASDIPGWRVEDHLGIVVAHVVAGVGLFSEFFAGFSDLFGGRSEAYRKQLASLYNEAIAQLLAQTRARGGNWLMGLRIDLDEVSGKGSQMFMITAAGTAVRAAPERPSDGALLETRGVSGTELQAIRRRLAMVAAAEAGSLGLDDGTWAFLIEQRVTEIAPLVLKWVAYWYARDFHRDDSRKRPVAYFAAIPSDIALPILYSGLSGDANERAAAQDLLEDLGLLDLAELGKCIESPDFEVQHAALQTLRFQQPYYGPADLQTVTHLLGVLDAAFPVRVSTVEVKGLLGGQKATWECSCGKKNPGAWTRCEKCSRDQRGFRTADVTPSEAAAILTSTAEALRESLGATIRP